MSVNTEQLKSCQTVEMQPIASKLGKMPEDSVQYIDIFIYLYLLQYIYISPLRKSMVIYIHRKTAWSVTSTALVGAAIMPVLPMTQWLNLESS